MTEREATEIPMVASRETRLVLSRISPVSLEKAGGGTGSRRLRSSRALDKKYPMLLIFRPRSRSVSRVLITCFAALASPVQPHRSSRRSLIILTYFQAMEIMALPTTTSPTVLIPFNFHTHHYHIYNGLVIPTPSGGYVGVTSDGVKIEHAMRSMEETGAASVTVGLYYQDSGLDHPARVTAVIDSGGNLRGIDRSSGRVG
ncbi:hypothetical protein FOBRF1_011927 [Fusarium oxysporum]